MNNKTKILCVFTTPTQSTLALYNIVNTYKSNILSDIYVYVDENDSNNILITATLILNGNEQHLHNSILVHRKYETNTLFTVNALNRIIIIENGELDKQYAIDWLSYKNSLLRITNDELSIINLIPLYTLDSSVFGINKQKQKN